MNQHWGKNRFLQPENFNIEMYLKFNLGPLHLLDNFVKEILASESTKSYLRKEKAKISRFVTNDLNKSSAMETIEKRIEKKSLFPNKLFCYWKTNRFFFPSYEFCNFYNGGFRFSTLYSPLISEAALCTKFGTHISDIFLLSLYMSVQSPCICRIFLIFLTLADNAPSDLQTQLP